MKEHYSKVYKELKGIKKIWLLVYCSKLIYDRINKTGLTHYL